MTSGVGGGSGGVEAGAHVAVPGQGVHAGQPQLGGDGEQHLLALGLQGVTEGHVRALLGLPGAAPRDDRALDLPPEKLEVALVQFAVLYRNGKKAPMSTRSGEFVTLRELRQEVGNDAARFFYVLRKSDQHLDFDLDLAKSQSNENPVYYVQYAHARVESMLRRLGDEGHALPAV